MPKAHRDISSSPPSVGSAGQLHIGGCIPSYCVYDLHPPHMMLALYGATILRNEELTSTNLGTGIVSSLLPSLARAIPLRRRQRH